MKIGVPKETADGERRVALVPEVLPPLTGAGESDVVTVVVGRSVLSCPSMRTLTVAGVPASVTGAA